MKKSSYFLSSLKTDCVPYFLNLSFPWKFPSKLNYFSVYPQPKNQISNPDLMINYLTKSTWKSSKSSLKLHGSREQKKALSSQMTYSDATYSYQLPLSHQKKRKKNMKEKKMKKIPTNTREMPVKVMKVQESWILQNLKNFSDWIRTSKKN